MDTRYQLGGRSVLHPCRILASGAVVRLQLVEPRGELLAVCPDRNGVWLLLRLVDAGCTGTRFQ